MDEEIPIEQKQEISQQESEAEKIRGTIVVYEINNDVVLPLAVVNSAEEVEPTKDSMDKPDMVQHIDKVV